MTCAANLGAEAPNGGVGLRTDRAIELIRFEPREGAADGPVARGQRATSHLAI